jgi:hypothetical protein
MKGIKNVSIKTLLYSLCFVIASCGCSKSSGDPAPVPPVDSGPKPVTKTVTKKVFAHLMPWFETNTSNGGIWGIHWTMSNQNPNIIEANGQRQIASHYYPLTGPYASGDTTIIEYQLLLMKLSGIDGVFIDWPGTQQRYDYPLLVRNTNKIIPILAKVGLNYSIVYEDQNLRGVSDVVGTAQKDMTYMQTNYFSSDNYEKMSGKPLLLVFGPQVITGQDNWTSVFSVLNPQPAFFTLWFENKDAGTNTTGEYAWIPQDNLATLNHFYSTYTYSGVKFGSAYPGFNSFYNEGGWGGPTWTIPHNNLGNFQQTLDLALAQPNINYIQLATWNDYGEGTMLEPTKEFQYGFLTTLQQKLGVQNLNQSDLEAVAQLYALRIQYAGDATKQAQLNQVFDYIVSLQMQKAKDLLATL